MKKPVIIIIALVAVSILVINAFKGSSAKNGEWADGIKWSPATTSQEEIVASGKHIYLFVTTDWCTFCKKMKAQTFTDPKVQEILNDRFYSIVVNPEKPGTTNFMGEELSYADLARKLKVTGYPANFFFDPEGTLVGGQPGFIDAQKFVDIAEFVGDGHYKNTTFAKFKRLPADQRR